MQDGKCVGKRRQTRTLTSSARWTLPIDEKKSSTQAIRFPRFPKRLHSRSSEPARRLIISISSGTEKKNYMTLGFPLFSWRWFDKSQYKFEEPRLQRQPSILAGVAGCPVWGGRGRGCSLRLPWVLKAFVAKRISFPFPFERLLCYPKGIKEFRSELTFFIYSTIFIQEPISSWLIWIPHKLFNQQTDQIASELIHAGKGKRNKTW